MSLTLLMMSFLYAANVIGIEALQSIEQKVDLSVVLEDDTTDEQITVVANDLRARSDVQEVRVVTSDEALTLFRQKHAEDPFIEESLKELDENPLPANLFIVATEPRFYEGIAKYLESEKFSSFIAKVNYENSRNVIDHLIRVITSVKNVGFAGTVIFAILVVLIMFNTIRLAIYSFREEIDIMRLVGASNWFIQGPFLFEAMFVAVLGVVVCNLLLFPFLKATGSQITSFLIGTGGSFDIYTYMTDHILTLLAMQTSLAVGLAVLSSLVAIRRYLRK